ncbi:GTP-binding protein REM 1-like [Babylonia areolata]|uniref:GTP-binding protein REM 1-like n=1 Tax=Babylonia areolata TaxID=304850 RepID=UPI003FD1EC42
MKSELLKPSAFACDIIMYGGTEKYLRVVAPVREVSSAPHSRSCSLKKTHRRPQDLDLKEVHRPRTNSLPSCTARHSRHRHSSDGGSSRESVNRALSSDKLCRVRSFKLTSKGVVNHGDCFKRMSTNSLMSTGSAASEVTSEQAQRPRAYSEASEASSSGVVSGGTGSCSAPSYFRVALLGSAGVGKSALLRQFMTSEYRGTFDVATPDTEDPETTVSVMLDGEESMVEFIDEPQEQELEGLRADGYVVVFSLADPQSYTSAVDLLRHLRVDLGTDRSILLVGNKVDLARQRRVEEREARVLATKYDCHYEETSAALNHHVDELLVAVLSQIRQRLAPPPECQNLLSAKMPVLNCCSPSPRRAISFLSKLFSHTKKTKSFDNLLVH